MLEKEFSFTQLQGGSGAGQGIAVQCSATQEEKEMAFPQLQSTQASWQNV